MSKCECSACSTVSAMPKFEVVDWACDGFTAACPSCGSSKISYTVSAEDIGRLPQPIAAKMLSEMYDS